MGASREWRRSGASVSELRFLRHVRSDELFNCFVSLCNHGGASRPLAGRRCHRAGGGQEREEGLHCNYDIIGLFVIQVSGKA
jgi:hypothetical protein